MAEFKLNEKVPLGPDKDTISVDKIDGVAPKPGKYKFTLVVVAASGLESAPQEIVVDVVRLEARLTAVNADGVELPGNKVKAGDKFALSAKGSNAGGDGVKNYLFTFIGPG